MLDPRLNHVVAVARFGSFTAAAQSVGVTQSAVTKGVADLERQLGYTLFHRTARGTLLTERGREFIERATRLLYDARELLAGPSSQTDPFQGVLRIGVCPASLEWQLIEPTGRMQKRHPNLRFEIIASSFERTVQQLRSGAVDVALGFDEAFNEWPEFRRSPVGHLQTSLFVRNGHPLLDRGEVTIQDLARYSLVSSSDSRPYGAILHQIADARTDRNSGGLHVIDYFPIVKKVVSNSDAIGVASLNYVNLPEFGRKFVPLALDLFPPLAMCCAVRKRWDPSASVRLFISEVRQTASILKAESI